MFPLLTFAQNFIIKGNIKDGAKGEPIEYATITLNTNDMAMVTGTTTNEDGSFGIEKVNAGSYRLKVSMIGYESTELEIAQLSANTDLGTIMLNEAAETLADVTVTGSNTINRVDRKLMFPSEHQKKASTNGMDIIRQLTVPKVQYNALNDELKATDGGALQLRINGIVATMQEVKAIRPDDIIRVEYHDNPSLRYGNVSVVLDYIVRRKESGGNINLNLKNSPHVGFGTDMLNAKLNHKKSEFSLFYYFNYRDLYQMWRNNLETYNYGDGTTLQRTEDGLPGRILFIDNYVQGTYNYQPSKNSTFNASFRYQSNHHPKGDYHSMLYNIQTPQNKVEMWDKSNSLRSRPSIDLYYEQKLRNDQTLFFNVVGTYSKDQSGRNYSEQRNGQTITDIRTNINGNNYSIIGEAIYEKQLKGGVLSAGVKHTQTWSDNLFSGNTPYNSTMKQSDSYTYAEWKGKTGKLSYTGGVGVARNWFKQELGEGYENYTFRPTFTLQYNFSDSHSIRLKGSAWNNSPSLTELSNVDQRIDSLQIQRGNPNLKPYTTYHTSLNYEIKKGWFTGILSGSYAYSPDAIMDEKILEGRTFVRTFNNQKDLQILNGELTLRASPLNGKLNLQFKNGINHYMSNGNNYAHRYTHWYYSVSASYTLKQFTFFAEIMDEPDFFRGENLYGGENLHLIGVNYRTDKFTIGANMINPFVDNYRVLNENWSKYASYKQAMYINESSRLFFMTFTYNLDFGRKYQSRSKRLNNQDNSSGVGSAGK